MECTSLIQFEKLQITPGQQKVYMSRKKGQHFVINIIPNKL